MRLWQTLRQFYRVVAATDIDLISAGVAFYAMFSVFPAIAALVAIFGLVADPVVIRDQLELLHDVIPLDAFELIAAQVDGLLTAGSGTLGWATTVSMAIALWSSRAGVGAIIRGLNQNNGTPARHGVIHFVAVIVLTLSLIAVALVSLAMVVVAPIVVAFVPIAREWGGTIEVIRWGVALFVLLAALGILYRYGPNVPRVRRVSILSPGAVLAVVLWLGASWGFSYYLTNFGNYNRIYGSLGAIMALLMWLYITSFLVLLGAAWNLAVQRLSDGAD